MNKHADSQINDAETARLLQTALLSPEHSGSLTLLEARYTSKTEMLGRWTLDTPEGRIHRIAVMRALDGEVMGFDACYRDAADALAVWEHIVEEVARAADPTAADPSAS